MELTETQSMTTRDNMPPTCPAPGPLFFCQCAVAAQLTFFDYFASAPSRRSWLSFSVLSVRHRGAAGFLSFFASAPSRRSWLSLIFCQCAITAQLAFFHFLPVRHRGAAGFLSFFASAPSRRSWLSLIFCQCAIAAQLAFCTFQRAIAAQLAFLALARLRDEAALAYRTLTRCGVGSGLGWFRDVRGVGSRDSGVWVLGDSPTPAPLHL